MLYEKYKKYTLKKYIHIKKTFFFFVALMHFLSFILSADNIFSSCSFVLFTDTALVLLRIKAKMEQVSLSLSDGDNHIVYSHITGTTNHKISKSTKIDAFKRTIYICIRHNLICNFIFAMALCPNPLLHL